jgi:beta-lactam-binding protein with PASTA domain
MYCTQCGHKIDDNAAFCDQCGAATAQSGASLGDAETVAADDSTSLASVADAGNTGAREMDAVGSHAGEANADADGGDADGDGSNDSSDDTADSSAPDDDAAVGDATSSASAESVASVAPSDSVKEPQAAESAWEAEAPAEMQAEAQPNGATPPVSEIDEIGEVAEAEVAEGAAPAPAATAPAATATAISATVTAATTAVSPSRRIRIIIALVAAIAVVVAALFGTYQAGLWGGNAIPDPAGVAAGSKSGSSAKEISKALSQQGFTPKVTVQFSREKSGTFLGYKNVHAGQHYRGTTVTVLSSQGPGVPKGTTGQSLSKAAAAVQDMGVPVAYKQVVVNSSKIKEGTVVASQPADGQPVTDPASGIKLAVAARGTGVSYDIVGTDKNAAQSQYGKLGFDVTLRPRFSAKNMLGKVVDSDPAPGTLAQGGALTLFYGIDASGMKDAVSEHNVPGFENFGGSSTEDDAVGAGAPVAGRYCNTKNDCIDFTRNKGAQYGVTSSDYHAPKSNLVGFAGANNLLFCGAIQQPFCSKTSEFDGLFSTDTGAFELLPYSTVSSFMCGDTNIQVSSGPAGQCVNGNWTSGDTDLSGARYDMGPLYVYFPVGADVNKVVASGYFDKQSVADAKKGKPVDTSRPFFIRRDKTLYDSSSIPITSLTTPNPFLPWGQDKLPVKPAPSDDTAYYLVDSASVDWDALSDVKNPPKPKNNAAADSAAKVVLKAAMQQAAGQYVYDVGTMWKSKLTVNGDGSFSGRAMRYNATGDGDTTPEHPQGTIRESRFTGRFASATKNTDGSYALQCDAGALHFEGKPGDSYVDQNTDKGMRILTVDKSEVTTGIGSCGSFTLYPKGFPVTQLGDSIRGFGGMNNLPDGSALSTPVIAGSEAKNGELFNSNVGGVFFAPQD